jgi:DNA-binding transcriptional ArsR family regulator
MIDHRTATMREAKAKAHPLRLRILRLCWQGEMTNKQLSDELGRDPGSVRYHVRQLVEAGLLEEGPVRHGEHGALEKPYRAKTRTWWLDDPPGVGADGVLAPLDAMREELEAAGPESVRTFVRFAVRLSEKDAAEFDRRIMAVVDEFMTTGDASSDQPPYGGFVLLHRMPVGDTPP